GFSDFVSDTSFSVDRGIYDNPVSVVISTATPGAEIRYTLDNSKPTANTGMVYSSPVVISGTTVLRAAAFKEGCVPTNVDTHTYIFTSDVIAHPNMDTGVTQDAVYGPQMNDSLKSIPTLSLTFQGDVSRTEREVSFEMINFEDGHAQVDAGMERFGGYVTNFAKVSMRVVFRKQYGPGKLEFPLFEDQDYDIPPAEQFDGLDIRAGNHDMSARGAYMSGRFVDDSMIEMGQIASHGRFVHLYLNGIYWGQYHLRERWNASMLSEYFGGVKEDYPGSITKPKSDCSGAPEFCVPGWWISISTWIAPQFLLFSRNLFVWVSSDTFSPDSEHTPPCRFSDRLFLLSSSRPSQAGI
ncbi:chitobiase/beta-hexosaminidase C-terminal domain-containing protein, partial [bacterium]|nr:chitobiase/beta-hexosaminidase C-terminal domain-containing protein [bacterium]